MHDFSQEEWKEEELEQLYNTHEALIDMALLFCFVPRDRYLPLGPIRWALSRRLECPLISHGSTQLGAPGQMHAAGTHQRAATVCS